MSEEIVELIGNETPSGHIRVRLDIDLPHEQAMQILSTVHGYKDRKRKEEEAELRRAEAERKKAEAAARKAAKEEAAKAKKAAAAKPNAAKAADAE